MKVYPPRAETQIARPICRVWDVLLEGANYPKWNRFIRRIEGDLRELNRPIRMDVQLGERMVHPTMISTIIEPPSKSEAKFARWVHRYYGVLPRLGLLGSERHHVLEALNGGAACLYKTHEVFWGPLKSFTPFAKIDAGFKQQALDLKTYCETQMDPARTPNN